MCGIVCYIGKQEATPILLEGLRRLEYRGYDSAGLAVTDGLETYLVKEVGKVSKLEEKVAEVHPRGRMGIAHTRWATHGRPSVANAHPHTGPDNKIFLVHNGIIENYLTLKEELIEKGHTFKSQTDTEVLVHLIEEYYDGDLVEAVKNALGRVQGTFGIALFHRDSPDKIVLARRGSPLILGIGRNEFLAASDVNALKLKEISYLHAEGYAAGEMKHGPISLIDPDFPTVAILPRDSTYDKMVSNIQEIKARDGKVLAIAVEGDTHVASHVDHVIHVPHSIDIIQPLLNTIPLQLFAYYIARERGCSIDKPRNLAKSVTVE